MVEPKRALVAPRVVLRDGGETEPLEDAVARLLDGGRCGLVEITGGRGSGKATAVDHLAAVLPASDRIEYHAHATGVVPDALPRGRLVVFTGRRPYDSAPDRTRLRLAPWGRDEIVECLLARGAERIAEIVETLPDGADPLEGNPELWAFVLDRMIASPGDTGPMAALRGGLVDGLGSEAAWREVRDVCLECFDDPTSRHAALEQVFRRCRPPERIRRVLGHRAVRIRLAADEAWALLSDRRVPGALSPAIAESLAARIGPGSAAVECLEDILEGPEDDRQRAAAEVLHAIDPRSVGTILTRRAEAANTFTGLRGARLAGAQWAEVRLVDVDLAGADLTGSILARANLENVNLVYATLAGATFEDATVSGCSLGGADLAGTDFTAATLRHCLLEGTRIESVGFTDAALLDCGLDRASLEGFVGPGFDLRGSDLIAANLTDSCLEHADLRRTKLMRARLSGARWRGADLRDANLAGATFHMGSTRGGLVDSPIASEGTRTGFYTEEREELTYRDPDEVRKADLRDSDLRGAEIVSVDLYLVDLRGARLDPEALLHARHCGAILGDDAGRA